MAVDVTKRTRAFINAHVICIIYIYILYIYVYYIYASICQTVESQSHAITQVSISTRTQRIQSKITWYQSKSKQDKLEIWSAQWSTIYIYIIYACCFCQFTQ